MQAPNRIAAIHGLGDEYRLPPSPSVLVAWGAILVVGGLLFWGALQEPKRTKMRGR
jgi:hypothetical protein